MSYLFAVTLFVSAGLLFCVEPLVGKMVLPLLGGSPAVWNTCLVFFQASLLAGYLYAHASSSWLRPRAQVALHISLLAWAALALPIAFPPWIIERLPYDSDPVPWLLLLLVVVVGLPFVVVAASAPLLQNWFALSGHTEGRDPYYLYAASNLGSMLALIGYPLIWEPMWSLDVQSEVWTAGYGLLLVLTIGCGYCAWRLNNGIGTPARSASEGNPREPRPTLERCLRWLVLSLVPSSLLLGVTTYVTTDLAAMPLLWVIPLALYLLSFILVFARAELVPHRWMVQTLPVLALLAAFTMMRSTATPVWQLIVLHWLTLFVACMVCHGELARARPAPRYLTAYYLWIALGGVLGGLATVFLAPWLFRGTVLEYPLALVLACLLRPGPGLRDSSSENRWLDLTVPGFIGVLCLLLVATRGAIDEALGQLGWATALVVPALACWLCAARPMRFALSLAVVFLIFSATTGSGGGRVLFVERNFFGIIRVQEDEQFRRLNHGSTLHGLQHRGPDGQPDQPQEALSYFHRSGPIGQVFELYERRCTAGLPRRVAVTGLGVGALASYAQPGEQWTYYELDPAMERAAQGYFTFLKAAERRGATIRIVLGDARLRLQSTRDEPYGLIVLDAFSSDAVPTHLLSREALELYRSKRASGGLLAFNVTNRYLDLKRVLADLAQNAHMICLSQDHTPNNDEKDAGLMPSQWVVLADSVEDLGSLGRDPRWRQLDGKLGTRVWSDAYSNVLDVFKWR
jgi:hypothetical protein